MRLAGTCSMYSKNAMPQLTSAATYHGRSLKLRRCAYHANVMNTFESVSRPTVVRTTPIRKSPSPILGEDRPALVIAPSAVDLEVSRRQSLAAESKFLYQRLRRAIRRLNVGLEAMQLRHLKGMRNDLCNALLHQPAAGERHERIVSEVRTAKAAVHHLADVDHSDQSPRRLEPDEERDALRFLVLRQVVAIDIGGIRGLHPRMVEPAAAIDCGEELGLICQAAATDENPLASHRKCSAAAAPAPMMVPRTTSSGV